MHYFLINVTMNLEFYKRRKNMDEKGIGPGEDAEVIKMVNWRGTRKN